MNLALSLLGVLLFLLCKQLIYRPDRGVAMWTRLLEVPVDLALLGFMLGVAAITQADPLPKTVPISLVTLVIFIVTSIAIWKHSCTTMSDTGGAVQFDRPVLLPFMTVVNLGIGVSSILVAVDSMGARP